MAENKKTKVRANSGYKGISRLDYPKRNQYGWSVRVTRAGQTYSKLFSDGAHGGKELALYKAILHRNRMEQALGKPRTDRVVMASQKRADTGVLGVHRISKQGAPVFEVTWNPEPNRVCRTSVSIRKYGEAEAFRRACVIRREKERKVYGSTVSREDA